MTDKDIIARLAAMVPTAPSEIDGDLSCFFCGAWSPERPRGDKHKPDCIWQAAVDLAKNT